MNSLEGIIEYLPELYTRLADHIGFDNMLTIAKMFSGECVYFQKFETLERPLRNRQIREEFNGYNFKRLAKKHNLTEMTIRNICEDIVKVERSKPMEGQISMFE